MAALERVMNRLFHTDVGNMFISGIFGISLAFMFAKVCKGDNCVVIEAPKITDVKDKIFQIQDECYTYTPHAVACDSHASPSTKHIY